jgi:flagellar basal body rod protein FlgG
MDFSFKIVLFFLIAQNLFSNDFSLQYEACLFDLSNYNTYGYKANVFDNGIVIGRNSSVGTLKFTDAYYHFTIDGEGYISVVRNNKIYYTRNGDFYYDYLNKNMINRDGFILPLETEPVEEATQYDIIKNIKIYNLDINKCVAINNTYFEYNSIPEINTESSIIFRYLERSNVSAFYCLLEMKRIVITNMANIRNADILLENINLLIDKLEGDEYTYRDKNNYLVNQWFPHLKLQLGDA